MIANRFKLAAGTAVFGVCTSLFALGAIAQAPQTDTPQAGAPNGGPRDHWRGPHGPEQEVRMLTHRLNLTPEQQTGVRAVLEQQQTQMRALRDKFQAEPEGNDTPEAHQARMTQMEQVRDESDAKISALLNDDQKRTYTEIVQQRKANMARRRRPDGSNPPPPPPQN
jgi:Spy/CpxP family protein refolding chaperone